MLKDQVEGMCLACINLPQLCVQYILHTLIGGQLSIIEVNLPAFAQGIVALPKAGRNCE